MRRSTAFGLLLAVCFVFFSGEANACRRGRRCASYCHAPVCYSAPAQPGTIYYSFGTDEAGKAERGFTVNVRNYSSYAVKNGTVTCNPFGSGKPVQLQFGYIAPGRSASKTVGFTPKLMGVYFKDGPGPDWGPGTISNSNPNLPSVNIDLYNQL
jgi:hypothetical protein